MTNLWKPGVFQGSLKKKGYFEGWYFKSVTADEKEALAIIPGVSLARDRADSHAFVMFMNARARTMAYFRYPLSDFHAADDCMDIRIGNNCFSMQGLRLDLHDERQHITGELNFGDAHPWPVTLLSPGAMGMYAFVPRMECYHGVLSFDHAISGCLEINGENKNFDGGKGYMEKDWGTSMPSSWIWLQTNHFDEDGVSLSGSIAKIPWLGSHFTGYLFGLYYKGRVYRFTTYTGAKITELKATDSTIKSVVEDRHYRLEISAKRTDGVDLRAPSLGAMIVRVNETLDARIDVRLSRKSGNDMQLLFSGTGRNSGLEVVGDLDELLTGLKRS